MKITSLKSSQPLAAEDMVAITNNGTFKYVYFVGNIVKLTYSVHKIKRDIVSIYIGI